MVAALLEEEHGARDPRDACPVVGGAVRRCERRAVAARPQQDCDRRTLRNRTRRGSRRRSSRGAVARRRATTTRSDSCRSGRVDTRSRPGLPDKARRGSEVPLTVLRSRVAGGLRTGRSVRDGDAGEGSRGDPGSAVAFLGAWLAVMVALLAVGQGGQRPREENSAKHVGSGVWWRPIRRST
jgi:hypothetical protein